MTLVTTLYTVGSNRPLNCARILWQRMTGTVAADGSNGALAANDYTNQRWAAVSGLSRWTLTATAPTAIDTVFIAAHNLTGRIIRAQVGVASRTNLLLRSEEIDNAYWTKGNATTTANAIVAPDGATTAENVLETVTSGGHSVTRAITVAANTPHTFSFFVRAQGRTRGRLAMLSGSDFAAVDYDLAAGTAIAAAGGTGSVSAVSITPFGNGWFRVRVSGIMSTTATSMSARASIANDAGSLTYAGDVTRGQAMWGFQLETGANLTSYIPTVAATASSDWQDVSPWVLVDDNSAIAIMTNNDGVPWQSDRFRLEVLNGANVLIGIIRAGVALQMEHALFSGLNPVGLTRAVETRNAESETGQWLGLTIQRQALRTEMQWQHLSSAWYRANFAPFAAALPQTPFGLIQNALRMPESVAWCWTNTVPQPQNTGVLDFMSVTLPITGLLE